MTRHSIFRRLLMSAFILLACEAVAADQDLFVVHFSVGPNWQADLPPAEQAGFGDHSANLNRLRKAGRIHFGARYGDLGMIFLAADGLDAAREELDADPGVVAGIFTYDVAAMRVFYPYQDP